MSAAALSPAVAASEHGRIPVLDIGPYLAGDSGAVAPLARAIARTCEDGMACCFVLRDCLRCASS